MIKLTATQMLVVCAILVANVGMPIYAYISDSQIEQSR